MVKFKVGDKVRRVKRPLNKIPLGFIGTIESIDLSNISYEVTLEELPEYSLDINNFKLLDLRDIIKEIVKKNG